MASSNPCRCRDCGGKAKLLESRTHKNGNGRRRRYGCLEPDCGARWSEWLGERSSGSLLQASMAAKSLAPAPGVRLCSGCGHWLNRCSLGLPESAKDPTFASLCAAWLGTDNLDPVEEEP